MLDVKLEDFQLRRFKLLKYASSLLKGKGFVEKQGELKAFSEDIVQNCYIKFHEYGLDCYVNEFHLDNFLNGLVYREFLHTIDINRRGAQYILLKKNLDDKGFIEPKQQSNVRNHIEEFDVSEAFKRSLLNNEVFVLEELLKGFSKAEISRDHNIEIHKIKSVVNSLRDKYNQFNSIKVLEKHEVVTKEYIGWSIREKNRVDKIILKNNKPIVQLGLDEVEIKSWDSAILAANELDLAASAISNCCKGKRMTHGGFKWKYKE
jgi:DNA-directed RNA polymerase specialized sigma24 family protein